MSIANKLQGLQTALHGYLGTNPTQTSSQQQQTPTQDPEEDNDPYQEEHPETLQPTPTEGEEDSSPQDVQERIQTNLKSISSKADPKTLFQMYKNLLPNNDPNQRQISSQADKSNPDWNTFKGNMLFQGKQNITPQQIPVISKGLDTVTQKALQDGKTWSQALAIASQVTKNYNRSAKYQILHNEISRIRFKQP